MRNAVAAAEPLCERVPEREEGFAEGRACMAGTALFMLVYGWHLCIVTWDSSIAEFPALSVGITYLPIPVGGLFTLLFIVERLWLGMPPPTSVMYRDQPLAE